MIQTLDQKVDEVKEMVDSLQQKKILMDDHWAAELPRRFLPKYVVNMASLKVHAVRDSTHTACGFEWRNSKDYDLKRRVENDAVRCEKPACQKFFSRFQE